MHRETKYRAITATLLTGVYIFVALFSQNFHTHGSENIFQENHFKKTEKSFSASAHFNEFSDCLACHLFHEGKVLLPKEFALFTNLSQAFKTKTFAYEQHAVTSAIPFIHLRGPPVGFF